MMQGLTISIMLVLAIPLGGPAYRWTEKGNQSYNEEDYATALKQYVEAQTHAPEAAELLYDIGNVLYRNGDYSGAVDSFRRALELGAEPLAADAAYNLGNALFREQSFADAADAYRETLSRRPDDEDALRNLEISLRQLQAQQQQDQTKDQKQDQEREEEKEEQEKPQDQPQQPPQDDESEQEPGQPEGSPENSEKGRDGESKPQPISREQAESLLDALRDKESEQKRAEAKKNKSNQATTTEKDW